MEVASSHLRKVALAAFLVGPILGVAGQPRIGALVWVYSVTVGLPLLVIAAVIVVVPSWIGIWRLSLHQAMSFFVAIFIAFMSLLAGLFLVGSLFWS